MLWIINKVHLKKVQSSSIFSRVGQYECQYAKPKRQRSRVSEFWSQTFRKMSLGLNRCRGKSIIRIMWCLGLKEERSRQRSRQKILQEVTHTHSGILNAKRVCGKLLKNFSFLKEITAWVHFWIIATNFVLLLDLVGLLIHNQKKHHTSECGTRLSPQLKNLVALVGDTESPMTESYIKFVWLKLKQ